MLLMEGFGIFLGVSAVDGRIWVLTKLQLWGFRYSKKSETSLQSMI